MENREIQREILNKEFKTIKENTRIKLALIEFKDIAFALLDLCLMPVHTNIHKLKDDRQKEILKEIYLIYNIKLPEEFIHESFEIRKTKEIKQGTIFYLQKKYNIVLLNYTKRFLELSSKYIKRFKILAELNNKFIRDEYISMRKDYVTEV